MKLRSTGKTNIFLMIIAIATNNHHCNNREPPSPPAVVFCPWILENMTLYRYWSLNPCIMLIAEGPRDAAVYPYFEIQLN